MSLVSRALAPQVTLAPAVLVRSTRFVRTSAMLVFQEPVSPQTPQIQQRPTASMLASTNATKAASLAQVQLSATASDATPGTSCRHLASVRCVRSEQAKTLTRDYQRSAWTTEPPSAPQHAILTAGLAPT